MTIIIQAPPDVEAALTRAASQEGISVEDYMLRTAVAAAETLNGSQANGHSSSPPVIDKTTALFAQWAADDPITSHEDWLERQREGEEFLKNLQADRMDFEGRTDFSFLLDDDDHLPREASTQENT